MDRENLVLTSSPPTQEYLAAVKVFPLIPALRKDVLKTIDSALSWEQLTASDINFSIVRPLVNKYARLKNMAVVYACLVVRSYFLAQADVELAWAGMMQSRAMLCEIMAMKLSSRFAPNHIQLVAVLTTRWNPMVGATFAASEQIREALGGDEDEMHLQSALEMAIATKAKAFIAFPVTQKVVNDIYYGRIVFTMAANRSILADTYKHKSIEVYDFRGSPFLDHYRQVTPQSPRLRTDAGDRLKVPFYGAILEFLNFAILVFTFVLCLSTSSSAYLTGWETLFILFAVAFTLEEYTAATEHGWILYVANLWNVFDFSFIAVFLAYLVLRIQGLHNHDVGRSELAFDILSCGACVLFPRLAFFAIQNNVVILSLRAMFSQYIIFMGMATMCFSGFCFALWALAHDPLAGPTHTFKSIAWLMVQIWFGNTFLSFAQAASFHPIFGPILMICFAALSSTLLLTILISLLSNTVATISANATQEYLFQFAIATMEGVKSDVLFSYQPPFNILAFLILKPASFILSPRALHSVNVFLIRLTSLPMLVVIGIYERHLSAGARLRESGSSAAQSLFNSLPRHIKQMPLVEALVGSSSNDLYDALFEIDITSDMELFDDEDEDFPAAIRTQMSRETLHQQGHDQQPQVVPPSPARSQSRNRPPSLQAPSPRNSPRGRLLSPEPLNIPSADLSTSSSMRSPLALLFGSRLPVSAAVASAGGNGADSAVVSRTENAVKRVEAMVEELKDLPVHRLKDEMKDLQDRQARIENLLLVLTRGMRNETNRHDSL